jgi:hypothetical protein
MQRIGAVCTGGAVLRPAAVQSNDYKVLIVIMTVMALVVGGITFGVYLWYLTPGPEQIK